MRQAIILALIIPLFFFVLFSGCKNNNASERSGHQITWSGEIASIIFKNCTPCHRPGAAGGFDLENYSDAVKKANLIRFVTRTRYMPPWPADPSYSHFVGETTLSEEEIRLIGSWVEQGLKRGDSLNEPKPPVFYKGSYFGKPDLTIKPQTPIQVKGDGSDAFLIVKYPFQLKKDTLIDFVEFVPHHPKRIHHVNGHLVNYSEGRSFDYFKGISVNTDIRSEMMDVYRKMHIPYTDKKQPGFPTLTPNTVYYLPGYVPPSYPGEIGGYRVKKNGLFLLNNIHFGPGNEDITDSSHINVFFRKSPIKRPVSEAQMGTFGISPIEPEFVIPPNELKTFHTQFKLSQPISMLSVNPHMHLIGKTFLAYAIQPDGDTIPLIRINKWDFRWQYYYTFKQPVKLEAGATIHVYGTFDNTNENVNNPYHPPRTITQGNGVESMKTTEEMFQFIFTYLSYKVGDEKIELERKNDEVRMTKYE